MNRRIVAIVGVVVLAIGALASCSGSGDDGSGDDKLTRDEFIDHMTSGDRPRSESLATCIADAFERDGIEVDEDGTPSEDDEAKAQKAVRGCFAEAITSTREALEGRSTSTTAPTTAGS